MTGAGETWKQDSSDLKYNMGMTIKQMHAYISDKVLPILKPWYLSFTHSQFWDDFLEVFEFNCPVFLFPDQLPLSSLSHSQSWLYFLEGYMNSQGHYKILGKQTTNICSPTKRTPQNICSPKKADTTKHFKSQKREDYKICVVPKKRTLQILLIEVWLGWKLLVNISKQ